MPRRIDELTQEQRARFAEWRDKWIAVGLSTEPANRLKFEAAVEECYRATKLEPPKRIVWVPSPIVGAIAFPIAAYLLALRERLATAKRDQRAVRGAVRGALQTQIRRAISSAIQNLWYYYIGGQFWVGGWYWGSPAFVTFFLDVCGLELAPEMERAARAYEETSKSACWWWPHRDFVMVCERPTALERNDRGQLNSRDGAAILWPDGWGVYSVNGVRVPRDVIEEPASITVKRIDEEGNAEIRRVMIEKYGLQRYLDDSRAEVLHEDVDRLGHPRKLVRKERPGDEPIVACLVKNSTEEPDGSRKIYLLRCHPELRPLLGPDGEGNPQYGDPQRPTCHNAVASTFGLRGEEYAPEVET